MTLEWVHPGLLLILGAWLLPFLGGRIKRAAMLILPAAALLDCVLMTPGTYGVVSVLGQDLTFGRVDTLSLVFSYVFSIMMIAVWADLLCSNHHSLEAHRQGVADATRGLL